MAESLTDAWDVGRNAYVIDTLAFRGILDVDNQILRFQIAQKESLNTWSDWLTVDGDGRMQVGVLQLTGYTVATLPTAPLVGNRVYVTDALGPTYGAPVVGGGAVVIPVFYDGVNWITA